MKRVLSLLLAAATAAAMSATAFAASQFGGLITGHVHQGNQIPVGASGWMAGDITDMTVSGNTVTYNRDINPNSRANDYINLTHDMFDPSGDRNLMSANELRSAKVEVKTSTRSGSQAIDGVTLSQRDGRIEIRYARELVKTEGMDFELTINLRVDGRNYNNLGITFVGTVANDVIDVYGDYDSVDLSEGTVAEAMEHNSKIEVDLGNGVTLHTKFFKGKKYYGTATRDHDESDEAVIKKYPDIDNVLTLKTVGLNSTGDIVKLAVDYSDYYVYDKNMKYLGQSKDMLPYSDKYYLANRKLNASGNDNVVEEDPSSGDDGNTEDPGEPTYVPGDNDGNGGGWFGGNNQDGSPDTGDTSYLSIAALAAVVSLGAITALKRGAKAKRTRGATHTQSNVGRK